MAASQRFGVASGARALLIHAALASARDWGALMAALHIPLDARAFDLPGHGDAAPWNGQGDYQGACADIALDLVARDFGRGPALLIGHSFGATVALRAALARPDLVRALVLFEPVLFAAAQGTPEHARHLQAEARMVRALEAGDPHTAAEHFLSQWGNGRPWQSMTADKQARLAARMPLITAGAPGLHDDSGAMLAPGRLEALDRPVLIVTGGASPPVVDAIARCLAARLPDCTCATVPGAGHMLPLTHARQSAEIIANWWAAVPGVPVSGRIAPEGGTGR